MGLRIVRDEGVLLGNPPDAGKQLEDWIEKISKVIPSGITALYLGIVNIIPEDQTIGYVILLILGLAGTIYLVATNSRHTEGDDKTYPVDWVHVGLSCFAFISWAYALGQPAKVWGIFQAWIALLVLAIANFLLTYVYKGSNAQPTQASNPTNLPRTSEG